MDKIYTKTGDQGFTSLGTGTKVAKTDARVEAYGTVDELASFVGLAVSMVSDKDDLGLELIWIQKKLFTITSLLAFPGQEDPAGLGEITEHDVKQLEQAIDQLTAKVPPLKSFILPGGTTKGATLHCARSVCRRAERQVLRLDFTEYPLSGQILPFLNRLSDYLFIAARFVNYENGNPERPAK